LLDYQLNLMVYQMKSMDNQSLKNMMAAQVKIWGEWYRPINHDEIYGKNNNHLVFLEE